MEYVAGLPDDFKLRGRTFKYILRKACADLLPTEIRRRGKMGFGVPLANWFRRDLRGYLHDHIGAASARSRTYVRGDYINRLIDEHAAGRADHSQQLWAVLTLEIWLRTLPAISRPWQN
jgi:asparagine synthase (glutamine-hydrolysing)